MKMIYIFILFLLVSCKKDEPNYLLPGKTYSFSCELQFKYEDQDETANYLKEPLLLVEKSENHLKYIMEWSDEISGGYKAKSFNLQRLQNDSVYYHNAHSFINGDSVILSGIVDETNSEAVIQGSLRLKHQHYYVYDTGAGSFPVKEIVWAEGSFKMSIIE